jgi:hypothetical protein
MILDKATTQFWVALFATVGLIVLTGISLLGTDQRMTDMLVGALCLHVGSSGSWLFRLNGYASGQQKEQDAVRVVADTLAPAVAAMHQENIAKLAAIAEDVRSMRETPQ